MVEYFDTAVKDRLLKQLTGLRGSLAAWRKAIPDCLPKERWITESDIADTLAITPPTLEVDGLSFGQLRALRQFDEAAKGALLPDDLEALDFTQDRLRELTAERNESFLKRELSRHKTFFENVEATPLSDEQARAVVCFDDRVLLVAAAGSGKTSTLVAKAGYALLSGLARPDEILVLVFNRDAAVELSERVRRMAQRIPGAGAVHVRNFHAFGLEVIGQATGRKPTVAPWLEGGETREVEETEGIIEQLAAQDSSFRRSWDLYRIVYPRDLAPFNEEPEPEDWDRDRRSAGFRTLAGEVVKSQEERILADWLFFNGVEYLYEPPYEVDTADEAHRQYRPDFYYPAARLYHEHFALDAAGNPPKKFAGYMDGVRWKRELHARHGTDLIETTSASLRSGRAFEDLERALGVRGIRLDPRADREISGQKPPTVSELARTFRVFMRHAKGNRVSMRAVREGAMSEGLSFELRRILFLDLYEPIAAEWDARLQSGGYIDFEDMLNLAADHIEAKRWPNPFRFVLADEFQDTSRARARLLAALSAGRERRLFAVGDDWQGIYRFTGADIGVMTDFEKRFGKSSIRWLTRTYRCPQSICDLAGTFVMKNPSQYKKHVVSANDRKGEPLVSRASADESSMWADVERCLDQLASKIGEGSVQSGPSGKCSVYLLGRYRSDCPSSLRDWQRRFSATLDLEFRTIHRAKGLEADYVFLLNVCSGYRGFPSLIEDDPVLALAMPVSESFPHAEERRLFYVALTRARRLVLAFTIEGHVSPFLVEVAGSGGIVYVTDDGRQVRACPRCSRGTLELRTGPYGDFVGCSRFPRCPGPKSGSSTTGSAD
jgi:DNA helicase-4